MVQSVGGEIQSMEQASGKSNEELIKFREENTRLKTRIELKNRLTFLIDLLNTTRHNFEDNRYRENVNPRNSEIIKKQIEKLKESVIDFHSFYGTTQPNIVIHLFQLISSFLYNPLVVQDRFLNFMFLGSAGTGKTTIAKKIANILANSGILSSDATVIEAGRADFIGQHLGETAPMTNQVLTSCLDKVLFIDEAYSLCQYDAQRGGIDAYGTEFASEFVKFQTEYKGFTCVICGGYKSEMLVQFLGSNEGMARRFTYNMQLEDFSELALLNIVKLQMAKHFDMYVNKQDRDMFVKYIFTKEAEKLLKEFLSKFASTNFLKNQAGSATNIGEMVALYAFQNASQYDLDKETKTSPDCLSMVRQFLLNKRKTGLHPHELISGLRMLHDMFVYEDDDKTSMREQKQLKDFLVDKNPKGAPTSEDQTEEEASWGKLAKYMLDAQMTNRTNGSEPTDDLIVKLKYLSFSDEEANAVIAAMTKHTKGRLSHFQSLVELLSSFPEQTRNDEPTHREDFINGLKYIINETNSEEDRTDAMKRLIKLPKLSRMWDISQRQVTIGKDKIQYLERYIKGQ